MFLSRLRSQFWKPGPIRIFRPLLPHTPGVIIAGLTNTSVLNHRAGVRSPPLRFGLPVTLARAELAPMRPISLGTVTLAGAPLCIAVTPEISHPPRIRPAGRLELWAKNGSV